MKLSRRTNTIILWLISLGLLVSMVIAFTPSLGAFFSGQSTGSDSSPAAIVVNGKEISELEVERARQNPLFRSVTEGEIAEDLELLLMDSVIEQELVEQAAAKTRVSSGEVRQAVNDFREQQGVAGRGNDQRYLSLIRNMGFDDAGFRKAQEERLRQEKYLENLAGELTVSDEEVAAFYAANPQRYASDARIEARQIVVESEDLAQELFGRVQAGEDFATLARENSVIRADRDGALGALEGSTEPTPVGRAALPDAVATAAFALGQPGVTEVVPSGSRYYIVNVEAYRPASTPPLAEVEARVRQDALEAKQAAMTEEVLVELRQNAAIEVVSERYSYDNEVLARVGDEEITRADLARALYLNPQIQQFLSPQNAELVQQLFRPSFLEQLIEQELARQGAERLGLEFVGSDAQVAQAALEYVSREATASDEAVQGYYLANQASFTEPASAVVSRVDFETESAATAFRSAVLDGQSPQEAAESNGGSLETLGTVGPGELKVELDAALFQTNAFETLPGDDDLEVSDILVVSELVEAENVEEVSGEVDAETPELTTHDIFVVLVANRTAERVRSLDEVRSQVEDSVLAQEQQALRDAWLEALRAEIEIENLMAQGAAPEPMFDAAPVEPVEGQPEESGEQ